MYAYIIHMNLIRVHSLFTNGLCCATGVRMFQVVMGFLLDNAALSC